AVFLAPVPAIVGLGGGGLRGASGGRDEIGLAGILRSGRFALVAFVADARHDGVEIGSARARFERQSGILGFVRPGDRTQIGFAELGVVFLRLIESGFTSFLDRFGDRHARGGAMAAAVE